MGIFNIFRRTKQLELVHPVYGRIVYQGNDTWEFGRMYFEPTKKEVDLLIDAGPEGPSDAHASYLTELSTRWPSLRSAWEPLLKQALANWIPTPNQGDIWSRVEVESLTIHRGIKPDEQWEFMFWCDEAGHWPTFVMHEWTPASCYIDG